MALDYEARNGAVIADSPATMRCATNAGSNSSNLMVYTLAAPPSGWKHVLWKISGPASTGGSSATVTFKSDVNNDGTVETIGRIAAAVTSNAAFEIPLVASLQPAGKVPLAIGGNGESLLVNWSDSSITALVVELTYSTVPDFSSPLNS